MTPFPANLKRHRLALGISMEKLARRLDVALNTIARWENGSHAPHLKDLERIAAALHVSVADLVSPVKDEETPISRLAGLPRRAQPEGIRPPANQG